MCRSASSAARPGNLLVLGVPGSRRVELLAAALRGLGLPPPRLIAYDDLLAGRVELPELVQAGDVVRIESPGRDWQLERALLSAGAQCGVEPAFEQLQCDELAALQFDRGRITAVRQWYLGWRALLHRIAGQLRVCPPHRLTSSPDEISVMFDKPACHARLEAAGIAVPAALGPISSFEQLCELMRERGWTRVFVKLAHGSSASGAVALALGTTRRLAVSTVELVEQGGEVRLYNSRRLQRYHSLAEIARLVDALCRHRVHVERWLPKAGIAQRTFDLRVVVIGGQARHVVARLSRGPVTNLHLLNTRGDVDAVAARMGSVAWNAALRSCELSMRCFPHCLYGGVDVLIEPGYRRHAVLEVNAFGDLLPDILSRGEDTYTAEIRALQLPAKPFDAMELTAKAQRTQRI